MKNKELEYFIKNNFNLTNLSSEIDSESEYLKYVQSKLAERIKFMIRSNMDRLLHILYRIDVPQKDTDKAFELGELNQVSMELARLIINRQLQKVDYAKKFYGK